MVQYQPLHKVPIVVIALCRCIRLKFNLNLKIDSRHSKQQQTRLPDIVSFAGHVESSIGVPPAVQGLLASFRQRLFSTSLDRGYDTICTGESCHLMTPLISFSMAVTRSSRLRFFRSNSNISSSSNLMSSSVNSDIGTGSSSTTSSPS